MLVRDTDDAVINHEIHYDVIFARTKHSYINNYPIAFTLFNYSLRDILLDTPWRIAETRVLFDRERTLLRKLRKTVAETNVQKTRDANVAYCYAHYACARFENMRRQRHAFP